MYVFRPSHASGLRQPLTAAPAAQCTMDTGVGTTLDGTALTHSHTLTGLRSEQTAVRLTVSRVSATRAAPQQTAKQLAES